MADSDAEIRLLKEELRRVMEEKLAEERATKAELKVDLVTLPNMFRKSDHGGEESTRCYSKLKVAFPTIPTESPLTSLQEGRLCNRALNTLPNNQKVYVLLS
ncbi:hypothetical protein EON65_46885 [archaeon]|nr:MAG: hypothetical protein EON65_46885 [archaeon]